MTIGLSTSHEVSSDFLTDKKFLDNSTSSTPLNSKSSLIKVLDKLPTLPF